MRLVSINLRKRGNDPHTLQALQLWLSIVRPQVLLVQEAVAQAAGLPPTLGGMKLIMGNWQVACWSRPGVALTAELVSVPALVVECDSLVICATYLSAYSSAARIRQLHSLRELLRGREKPVVLVGDFNLAPTFADGRYGDDASKWTSKNERAALSQLVNEIGVVDLTSRFRLGEQQFTFERVNKGRWTRFRCDLAFAPGGPAFTAKYDHDVRKGSHAFTDHSACIVDASLVALAPEGQGDPPNSPATDAPAVAGLGLTINSHNTAIRRTQPSKPLRALVASGTLARWRVASILDYGCGHGADVRYLASLGYSVTGYDPYPGFGREAVPRGRFDLVLLIYVLNVLPTPQARLAALRGAAQFLAASGRIVVVARSASEIEREAEAKMWTRHSDGYMSNTHRGMFQHGMTHNELARLLDAAALNPSEERIVAGSAGVSLIGTRREPDCPIHRDEGFA